MGPPPPLPNTHHSALAANQRGFILSFTHKPLPQEQQIILFEFPSNASLGKFGKNKTGPLCEQAMKAASASPRCKRGWKKKKSQQLGPACSSPTAHVLKSQQAALMHEAAEDTHPGRTEPKLIRKSTGSPPPACEKETNRFGFAGAECIPGQGTRRADPSESGHPFFSPHPTSSHLLPLQPLLRFCSHLKEKDFAVRHS